MGVVTCTIRREVDVYLAIGRGRDMAAELGFNDIDRTRIEIIILELARNLIMHSHGGDLHFEKLSDTDRQGMAITVQDTGPGIEDIELALRDGYSTTHTLGTGLPGVRRLADEFTIESTVGVGTMVRAVKWVSQRRNGGLSGASR